MLGRIPLVLIYICVDYCNANVVELQDMFKWLIPNINVGDASSYGNYCGLGGNGTPTDEFDRCCQVHDQCYGNSEKVCNALHGALVPYKWEKSENKVPECVPDQAACRLAICKCDGALILCMRENEKYFRKENVKSDQANKMGQLESNLNQVTTNGNNLRRSTIELVPYTVTDTTSSEESILSDDESNSSDEESNSSGDVSNSSDEESNSSDEDSNSKDEESNSGEEESSSSDEENNSSDEETNSSDDKSPFSDDEPTNETDSVSSEGETNSVDDGTRTSKDNPNPNEDKPTSLSDECTESVAECLFASKDSTFGRNETITRADIIESTSHVNFPNADTTTTTEITSLTNVTLSEVWNLSSTTDHVQINSNMVETTTHPEVTTINHAPRICQPFYTLVCFGWIIIAFLTFE